jgi:hypothetical protein
MTRGPWVAVGARTPRAAGPVDTPKTGGGAAQARHRLIAARREESKGGRTTLPESKGPALNPAAGRSARRRVAQSRKHGEAAPYRTLRAWKKGRGGGTRWKPRAV